MQEHLLRQESLTLNKAADLCRSAELSKEQVKIMNPVNSYEIDRVKTKSQNKNASYKEEKKFNCNRCQTTHGPRQCPAYGKKCGKCGTLNHFAVSCRVRRVHTIQEHDRDSLPESLFCGMVINGQWTENIIIESSNVKCRLDTGADVSVMPRNFFKSLT